MEDGRLPPKPLTQNEPNGGVNFNPSLQLTSQLPC